MEPGVPCAVGMATAGEQEQTDGVTAGTRYHHPVAGQETQTPGQPPAREVVEEPGWTERMVSDRGLRMAGNHRLSRGRRAAVFAVVILSVFAAGGNPSSAGEAGNSPPSPRAARGRLTPSLVPAVYQPMYNELAGTLQAFSTRLDNLGSGVQSEPAWGGTLSPMNGNRGPAMISAESWSQTLDMLDAFERMGVTVVKVDITYPMLTPAFHQAIHGVFPSYTLTAEDFIARYRDVADAVHARGMTLLVEHSSLFRGGWAVLDPTGYYASIAALGAEQARQRYGSEHTAEALAIAADIQADWITLLDEPDTQNANFGLVDDQPLFTPAAWIDLVRSEASSIHARGLDHPPILGAGSGSWDDEQYVQAFAAMPELDSVDIHIYPIATPGGSLLDRVLQWSLDIRSIAPNKRITIGEAWLYKATAAEVVAGADARVVYGRDVYSFWHPLDELFLSVLAHLARQQGFAVVCPFWTSYFFAYLRWGDPALAGLTPLQLIGLASDRAWQVMPTGALTPTGTTWSRIAHGS